VNGTAARTGLLARLGQLHDGLTRAGFVLAAVGLAAVVCTFTAEVVLRYFLNSPTSWAGSAVSYLLCIIIFMVLPDLTRQRTHIFISVLPDALSTRAATALVRAGYLAGFIVCLLAAGFCADITWNQYVSGIETLNEWHVPKWTVSIFIPYGLASTSLYFLRHALSSEPYHAATGMVA
jgi:TRAP-type C4-dicarboxylate transport system permease small subunit